jgi:peptidoglycan/LPS O-acetylase OafA/YrhL
MQPAVSVLIGGILPFGAVFVELFFILSSLWLHQVYVSCHGPNSGPLTASARRNVPLLWPSLASTLSALPFLSQ